jgi:hypothetical protein
MPRNLLKPTKIVAKLQILFTGEMEQKNKKGFGSCLETDPGRPSKPAACAGARDSKSRSILAAQDAWHARAWPRERAGR